MRDSRLTDSKENGLPLIKFNAQLNKGEAIMMRAHTHNKELYKLASKIGEELSPETLRKVEKVKTFLILQGRQVPVLEICSVINVSRSTIFRWVKYYKEGGPYALKSKSTKPHRFRCRKWSKELIQIVLRYRKEFPAWGKNKLTIVLNRKNINVSESTVGRILAYLVKQGKCFKASACNRINNYRTSRKRWYAKRIRDRLRPKKPGEVIQIDSMSLSVPGIKFKQFTATCVVSRWCFLEVFSRATSLHAANFLQTIIREAPFEIKGIQVDGGSEFMKDFEEECHRQGIVLYVLPPRSPEMNGNVERTNGLCRREFYEVYDLPYNLAVIRKMLKEFQHTFNHFRPHFSLQGLTPAEAFYGSFKTEAIVPNVMN